MQIDIRNDLIQFQPTRAKRRKQIASLLVMCMGKAGRHFDSNQGRLRSIITTWVSRPLIIFTHFYPFLKQHRKQFWVIFSSGEAWFSRDIAKGLKYFWISSWYCMSHKSSKSFQMYSLCKQAMAYIRKVSCLFHLATFKKFVSSMCVCVCDK